ncbi:MAG: LysM peptidoglycan-binding domain-containing protein [Bacteroidales bacterium]|nr:LysM peptidoglycan-binding domain-containing protein [Bacteroidales bacterium]
MRIVYLFVLILFTLTDIYGQDASKITTEKVKVGDNLYYAHTVRKKETLYSLSKAYNVTIEEIVKHNRAAESGLKTGTILYIPVNEADSALQEPAPAQEIAVKQMQAAEQKSKKQTNKKYKKHTVKWYEDITDISEKYGVSVEAIMALNNLKSSKLKTRQSLLIPDKEYVPQNNIIIPKPFVEPSPTEKDTTAIEDPKETVITSDTLQPAAESKVKFRKKDEPVEIAYILPFGSVDTSRINSNFMDFYAGSLLAANDMKNSGVPVKINVYDQSEYNPLHSLIDSPGFSNNQLIVGPARAKMITAFTGYSQNAGIPLVSPLDNAAESMADENPYFIQMPANTLSQIGNTIDLLDKYRTEHNSSTVLLICEKGTTGDSVYVNNAKKLLEERGINYKTISYGILEGRQIYGRILSSVDTLSENEHIALVPSNSEAFVSDVVRNLDLCRKPGANITLFGLPKWRNFETINVELFHKLKLHISLPYFVDYSNQQTIRFLQQYRALYGTEPTPYAYQGYDITKYILKEMALYGNSFVHSTELEHARMLQSDFRLKKDSEQSGLKNRATRNIVYNPDYTISVID